MYLKSFCSCNSLLIVYIPAPDTDSLRKCMLSLCSAVLRMTFGQEGKMFRNMTVWESCVHNNAGVEFVVMMATVTMATTTMLP